MRRRRKPSPEQSTADILHRPQMATNPSARREHANASTTVAMTHEHRHENVEQQCLLNEEQMMGQTFARKMRREEECNVAQERRRAEQREADLFLSRRSPEQGSLYRAPAAAYSLLSGGFLAGRLALPAWCSLRRYCRRR